jgi:hypothetical protein
MWRACHRSTRVTFAGKRWKRSRGRMLVHPPHQEHACTRMLFFLLISCEKRINVILRMFYIGHQQKTISLGSFSVGHVRDGRIEVTTLALPSQSSVATPPRLSREDGTWLRSVRFSECFAFSISVNTK